MARYIDACLAIRYIHDHYHELDFMDSGVPLEMEHVIRLMPTADVKPVVHSHWEPVATHTVSDDLYWSFECCNCGYKTQKLFLYCPYCGAMMDEEV